MRSACTAGAPQVELAQRGIEREQRLDLGGEHELARVLDVVEGLLSELVARREQALAPLVPDREREHAAQAVHAGVAPLFVAWTDHLGVAAGREVDVRGR